MVREDLVNIRANWFWFVALGILLILMGLAALSYSILVTITAVIIFGYFLLASGIFYVASSLFTGGWGGFFLSLLCGFLQLAVGLLVLHNPARAGAALTLLMAMSFFVTGLFRIFAALSGQFRGWGWVLLSGIVTLALGVMIWQEWPDKAFWVIGTFIGIDLIFNGWTYVSVGMSAKRLPV